MALKNINNIKPAVVKSIPQKVMSEPLKLTKAMSQADVSTTINAISLLEIQPQLKHWQQQSKPFQLDADKVYIAIVIDDVGVVPDRSRRSVEELPREVTLSFLPYGSATAKLSKKAVELGHEVMIHLPMQPKLSAKGAVVNPGKNALYTNLNLMDISPLVEINLKDLAPLAVGVNNHMGSQFTEWAGGLKEVFKVLEKHEMMFLDSLTTSKSTATGAVRSYDIPFLKRDVFLDHEIESAKIMAALEKTERVAQKQGYAIAIGHPHIETTEAIKLWAKSLATKNIQLVPITALIKRK